MPSLLDQYLPLVVFMAISAVISGALLLAPFIVAFKAADTEKLSAYECGFNAFDDARMQFDVRFYLVSLLFIIFDLEVAFLFPWAVGVSPGRRVRLLVDDGVSRDPDRRLRLRMEEGRARMGLTPSPRTASRSRRPGPSARRPTGRCGPTIPISARSTTNSPTRGFWSRRPGN